MATERTEEHSIFLRKIWPFLLAGCWISGLLLGNIGLFFLDRSACILPKITSFSAVSVADLAVTVMVPIVLSVTLSRCSWFWLLILAFFKTFSCGFSSALICLSVQNGGWLLRSLWMFGTILTLPLLYWYLLGIFRNRHRYFRILTVLIFGILICITEYKLIIPVLL